MDIETVAKRCPALTGQHDAIDGDGAVGTGLAQRSQGGRGGGKGKPMVRRDGHESGRAGCIGGRAWRVDGDRERRRRGRSREAASGRAIRMAVIAGGGSPRSLLMAGVRAPIRDGRGFGSRLLAVMQPRTGNDLGRQEAGREQAENGPQPGKTEAPHEDRLTLAQFPGRHQSPAWKRPA